MRAVVVYESMFGNTHAIADAIGKGIGQGLEPVDSVVVVPVVEAVQRPGLLAEVVSEGEDVVRAPLGERPQRPPGLTAPS